MVNVVEPKVEFIAGTEINFDPIDSVMEVDFDSSPSETLMTFAGRNCYQSFSRPRPETANDADYLERTLFEQGHWSIAEHATATFYITGVSRAFLTELTRHRHLSFSVLSQRFVDESDLNIVIPPALRENDYPARKGLERVSSDNEYYYRRLTSVLAEQGLGRKQAREAARAVLPNMVETRIVVTGNLRTWHEVIERRTQPDVDAEMREVMLMIEDKLADVSPVLFGKDALVQREKKAARAERKKNKERLGSINITLDGSVYSMDKVRDLLERLGARVDGIS
ncbi:FAD-dependent thymidylate synthase [Corynebacterium phoceense]|uniref:FAD-dependent thymidylate synthase n=1 Tax=Corynebacterium phoceense TaxID=1686286 RepID=UPI00211CE710|nr:FAD-dependent thymidylate synthase [Corynebacterium phoceense]MCQ9340825.1 FAD-dependent thymidylate synthase [Corynebacterium phoceense]